jgi:transcriptional regulator with XRE-family HTH domain
MNAMSENQEGRRLVALNLRTLRQKADMSQEELAHAAGVDRSHLARFESQYVNVSLDILLSLARALEVDVSEFFAKSASGQRDR